MLWSGQIYQRHLIALWTARKTVFLALALELLFIPVLVYEGEHFAAFGYHFRPFLTFSLLTVPVAALATAAWRKPPSWRKIAGASVMAYVAGVAVSVLSFPFTYLRSDMLAVILWADQNLLRHIDPYHTIYIHHRVYDFPYLPGMLLAYVPFTAAHLDLRLGSLAYTLATAGLILWAARQEFRLETAALVAIFLLNPFLQYRHELYIQPHWFTLVLALVLAQRRRFALAAAAFGLSMAIYQFSWVIFPFFLLYGFWRRGWSEPVKLCLMAAASALALDGAFLRSAFHKVASNTVGQWNHLPHAVAEPMNLSYWATYVIAPAHLQRLQAVLMVLIFGWCVVRRRCTTFADTLRWMTLALTVFILFNVIIDGYFFLTLLVLALAYVCVANGWWYDPESPTSIPPTATS